MLVRKTTILAKIESSYGVDPTPTASANCLLIKDPQIKPKGESLVRDVLRASLSPLGATIGMKEVEVTFKTELKGTGTRGQLPAFGWEGVLFRACGMSETVSAGTSITYQPVSTGFESCTLYIYKDGIRHIVTGCRGSFKITGEVGKPLEVEWSLKGIYNTPTDASPAAVTVSPVLPQPLLNAGFTIGAYAAVASKIEIDLAATIGARKSINHPAGIVEQMYTGRDTKGSFDPIAVLEATHPFWQRWTDGTLAAMNLGPIGATSGNIVTITAPKVQYMEINYGDREGEMSYDVPLRFCQDAGDDELVITIT